MILIISPRECERWVCERHIRMQVNGRTEDHTSRRFARPCRRTFQRGRSCDVRIHKFGFLGKLYLLAYEVDEGAKSIYVYAVGGHESFYRDLKNYLKSWMNPGPDETGLACQAN